MNYLKISRADQLTGKDKTLYRALEILPGFLSWLTLLGLIILSYFQPLWVAYFIIVFDVYWLLLVIYLSIHLLAAYKKLKANLKVDWQAKCQALPNWQKIWHLVIIPTYQEGLEILRPTFQALVESGYDLSRLIVVLAIEERAGPAAQERAQAISREFGQRFGYFLITCHPANIAGEIKGKGANQAWAARVVKEKIIDANKIDYDSILVSVFDCDTVVYPGYFHRLTYVFLTTNEPYRASYQPIPVYHNNIWQAPFFARVSAASNTFWQMMQQIRVEKLATYSSHSMTWRALVDIGFWSTNMVSEDSRIFWHCFCYYRGHYRVEPLYFPVSMDVTMDETFWRTMKNLYKQQRRWGWGVENIPYLIFNFIKLRRRLPRRQRRNFINKILVQLHGFHSWATNALIIAFVGWAPIFLGGARFNSTVLSSNLPTITENLMTVAMIGLVVSAIVSTLLLPPRPKNISRLKFLLMPLEWIVLPAIIIIFGSIPGLEAQTRLMLGKYLGFWVTPKKRKA